MTTAKVFRNGRSQAIRLPKEFRVDTDEVYLRRTPEGILMIPRNPWDVFAEGIRDISDEFFADGRQQPEQQPRAWTP